jgi:hypothetical protein
MEKNVGGVDAFMRVVLGVAVIYMGMFLLGGVNGSLLGIIVALISLVPFYMAVTRKCFVFKLFNLSTIPGKDHKEPL